MLHYILHFPRLRVLVNPAKQQKALGEDRVRAGQTAVVDANNLLKFYEANGQTSQLPNGWQRVPPTVNQGTDVVRNPQQFVEYNSSNYTQQAPNAGANEYVLTNGIDFGVEIKY